MMNCSTTHLAMVRRDENVEKWLHVTNYFCCVLAGVGGFLPAVKQIANVAALPGIVGVSHYCSTCMHKLISLTRDRRSTCTECQMRHKVLLVHKSDAMMFIIMYLE